MKVLDLQCAQGHGFEGWFASEDDYQSQQTRGLLSCPVCDSTEVIKLLSAPRLNLRGSEAARPAAPPPARADAAGHSSAAADGKQAQALQAAWLGAVRRVLAQTEDVGARFAEEARRMHYGESQARPIRGQASLQEADALQEEGIEVAVLPIPPGLDGKLQ